MVVRIVVVVDELGFRHTRTKRAAAVGKGADGGVAHALVAAAVVFVVVVAVVAALLVAAASVVVVVVVAALLVAVVAPVFVDVVLLLLLLLSRVWVLLVPAFFFLGGVFECFRFRRGTGTPKVFEHGLLLRLEHRYIVGQTRGSGWWWWWYGIEIRNDGCRSSFRHRHNCSFSHGAANAAATALVLLLVVLVGADPGNDDFIALVGCY